MKLKDLTKSQQRGIAYATDTYNATLGEDDPKLSEEDYALKQLGRLGDDYERQRLEARENDKDNKGIYRDVLSLPDELKAEAKAAVQAILERASNESE